MLKRNINQSKESTEYGRFSRGFSDYSQRNSIRPFSPEKIQSVISSISHRKTKSQMGNRSPLPQSRPQLESASKNKNYLESTLWYREVYIIQDGIHSKQDLLNGFKYKFFNFGNLTRWSQALELSYLLEACSKKWLKKKFVSLFTIEGKLIKSLAEVPSNTKILVASHSFKFIGLNSLSVFEVTEIVEEAFYLKDSETFVTCPRKKGVLLNESQNPMAQPESFLLKLRQKSQTNQKIKPIKQQQSRRLYSKGDKVKYMSYIKDKLGETSSRLDRRIPNLPHETLLKLMKKYELSESRIYKVFAQYKTLLLISVGQNPNHDIQKGISKQTLIEYLRRGDPKEDGLIEKLIETIDYDGKGVLQWEEFLKIMSVIYFGSISQQIDMIFKMYDNDLSGTLSYSEIKGLCAKQLKTTKEDNIAEYLSESFAKIIFQMAGVPISKDLSVEEIKRVLNDKDQQPIIQMFCNFEA